MASKTVVQKVVDQLQGYQLIHVDDYYMQPNLPINHVWLDMPIRNVGDDQTTTHITHAFDVVEGAGDPPSMEELVNTLSTSEPLPTPWNLKGVIPPCTKEHVLITEGDTWLAIKHMHFHNRASVIKLQEVCLGTLKVLDSRKISSPKHTPQIVHYLMANMGGIGVFKKELQIIEKQPKMQMSSEQINRGYDHIQDHGPKGSSQNQNMRWADIQRHDPTSPIYNWPAGLIKEALHNLTTGKSLAQVIDKFPITLYDIKNWVLTQVLKPVMPRLSDTGLLLVGVSGIGKTPLANAIGMGVSGWWLQHHGEAGVPSFKTTNHIDFLRSEPGSVYVPIVYDDGELELEKASVLKAFFDVGCEDPKVYARWGASAFAKHQYRIACSNTFDGDADATTPGDVMDHDQFVRLIAGTFSAGIKREDLMAIFKRVNVIVFGHLRVYVRKASEKIGYVQTVAYDANNSHDLLLPNCKDRIRAHKRGQDPDVSADQVG